MIACRSNRSRTAKRSNITLAIVSHLLRQPLTARQLQVMLVAAVGKTVSVRQIRRAINEADMSGFRVSVVGYEPSTTGKGKMFNVYKMEVV